MQFDAILKIVGEFGPYQKRIYVLLCLPVLCISMYDIIGAYLMYTPKHRCAADSSLNSAALVAVDDYDNNVYLVNTTEEYMYGSCHIKEYNNMTKRGDNATSHPCSSWIYDKTVFKSTFVSENDLVCASASTSAYIQMAAHCGSILGSLLQGIISDRFGRKITICGSTALVMLAGVGSALTTNIYVFTILRFMQIICSAFTYLTSFVLGLEIVGPSKRCLAGIWINYFYTFGTIVLAGLGYGLRHWKYIQIACSAPATIFLVYWWLIPESPRWLISQGKQKEARNIILKIAKSNNRDDILSLERLTDKENDDEPVKRYRIWHLLSSRSMFFKSVIIWVNWFVVSLTYYGFFFNAGNLSGDFYVNQLIAGLVEIPATMLLFPLLNRLGRMKLYILGMLVGGIFMVVTGLVEIFISIYILTVTLAMIGKIGVTIGFSVVYIWAAELFPTPLRSTAMGLSCAWSNIGYILMPYIVQLTSTVPVIGKALTLLLFGGLALAASLLTLLLPETTNKDLPETLQTESKPNSTEMTSDVTEQAFLPQTNHFVT